MASRRSRKKSKPKDSDLIPIMYQVPGGIEITSGYLEKNPLPDGRDPMRFFGHYQCTNCSKKWTSGYAWQGFQLECKKCDIYEWPVKVYHLETHSDDYVMKKPHLSSLCEKCQEDGVHCLTRQKLKPDNENFHKTKLNNGDEYYHEYVNYNENEYMIHFKKQMDLAKHDIIIEPSFIENLFDCLWEDLSREEESEFKEALKITAGKWKKRGRNDLADECKRVLKQTYY